MDPAAPLRLVPLGPEHAEALLAGQDAALSREIAGRTWDGASLAAFLHRAAGWTADGPLRELAALDARGALIGGGGVHRLGPGLERGQADISYWVLAAHRGRGHGTAIARALVDLATDDSRIGEIVLRIAPDNCASRAIARGLGAHPTGVLERHLAEAARTVERWTLARPDRPPAAAD